MEVTLEQKHMGEQLLNSVVQKAQEDNFFRRELINSPHQTIEKLSKANGTISRDIDIVVDDQTDDSKIYLVIPAKYELNDFDLTDEQLEMVAGGEGICIGTALLCYGAGVAVGALVVGGAYVVSHLQWK